MMMCLPIDLKKDAIIIIEAPLNNEDDTEFTYHLTNENKTNPLWVAKVIRTFGKRNFIDLVFYKSNGKNVLSDKDTIFILDEGIYRVLNIKDAFLFNLSESDKLDSLTIVSHLASKIKS
jgi:hypothetical protein